MANEIERLMMEAEAEYKREAAEILRIQTSLGQRIADQITRRAYIRELARKWVAEGHGRKVQE